MLHTRSQAYCCMLNAVMWWSHLHTCILGAVYSQAFKQASIPSLITCLHRRQPDSCWPAALQVGQTAAQSSNIVALCTAVHNACTHKANVSSTVQTICSGAHCSQNNYTDMHQNELINMRQLSCKLQLHSESHAQEQYMMAMDFVCGCLKEQS